jgi:uncharacterized protein DUF6600
MNHKRIVVASLIVSALLGASGLFRSAGAQEPGSTATPASEVTPPRVSYLYGDVSFWRPGASDWAPAQLNTPIAPGDAFYTGPDGNVEVQIAPGAFVRGSYGTQIGLDNLEPDYIQLRVTGGRAALDLRRLPAGTAVELDTPNAAFTVERAGYYHVDVNETSTSLSAYRGGSATVTPAGGAPATAGSGQQVVISGADAVQVGAAPTLSAWDQWNDQRTRYLTNAASAKYVSPALYGTEALDQYGSWRTVPTYGSVWMPTSVPAGWVPYSTGRWIWDPRFGWTWLDDAPWGWAPYHHGRWVFVDGSWAWAPGPIIARPVYAPALVVFLGGGGVAVGRPVHWAPLAWGEPVIPWWGRPGFAGRPSWTGWGGPHVVNNVVVDRSTTVNVTNVTVYKNVNVTNAVVGVPSEQFGRGRFQAARTERSELQQLKPVAGAPEIKPVAASVAPATGPAAKPPETMRSRPVVATRPPVDPTPALREHGLSPRPERGPEAAPRLVPSPRRAAVPNAQEGAPPSAPGGPRPSGPQREGTTERPTTRSTPNATPNAPQPREGAVERTPTAPPSGGPTATPQPREGTVERPGSRPGPGGSPATTTPQPPATTRSTPPSREGSGERPPTSQTPAAPPTASQPVAPQPREGAVNRPTTPPPPTANRPSPAPPERGGPDTGKGRAVESPRPPGPPNTTAPQREGAAPESRRPREAERRPPTSPPGPPPAPHQPTTSAPPGAPGAPTPAPEPKRGPAQQPPQQSRQRGAPERGKGETAEQPGAPAAPNAPKAPNQ